MALEFTKEELDTMTSFASNLFYYQSLHYQTLIDGLQAVARGVTDLVANGKPIESNNGQISVISSKVSCETDHNFNGTGSALGGNQNLQFEVPLEACQNNSFIQMTTIVATKPYYSFSYSTQTGQQASPVVSVNMFGSSGVDDQESTTIDSTPLTIANLSTPIKIRIPITSPPSSGQSLVCGATNGPGTLSQSGLTTQVLEGYVICSTTHLTEFVVEKYTDSTASEEGFVLEDTRLGIEKSAGFWMMIIFNLFLIPLIVLAIFIDKWTIKRWPETG